MSSDVVEVLRRAKQAQLDECQRRAAEFDVLIEQAQRMTAGLTLTPLNPTEGLRALDGLPIREAIREYLEWAESKGKDSVGFGDLLEALTKFRVLTSQREPLSSNANPRKVLATVLGAPQNKEFFEVEKRGLHIEMNDVVRLVHKARRKA